MKEQKKKLLLHFIYDVVYYFFHSLHLIYFIPKLLFLKQQNNSRYKIKRGKIYKNTNYKMLLLFNA